VNRVTPNPILWFAIFVVPLSEVGDAEVEELLEFELEGVDFGPVDAVVDAGLGRRLTGFAFGEDWAGFSFGRLVKNAPRTFSSSC
jgi:hypothetical protein